jgi:hydrogenase maturation protein HypF
MKIDIFDIPIDEKEAVLALGPESVGNFSVYRRGKIYFCPTDLDLLGENSFAFFKRKVLSFLRDEKIKPKIILVDLHPQYRTTIWGEELARIFRAKNIKVQHHLSHIFSAVGDRIIRDNSYKMPNILYGIACDGTGYGPDGKIWGGEVFQVKSRKGKITSLRRVGHLENQVLIGGDLAVKEPARMLISILDKLLEKDKLYQKVKKYYSRDQFEILYRQKQFNFNCEETSSTARVLDAVSVFLGYSENTRKEKHGPVLALERNSASCSYPLKPKIILDNNKEKKYILLTTPLFQFLLRNFQKNKAKLAATAQLYIAQGLSEIVKKISNTKYSVPASHSDRQNSFFAGGMADNKLMSSFLSSKGFYLSQEIPRGDRGLSFGQVFYYLLSSG